MNHVLVPPDRALPLVRHLSWRVSLGLARLPVTPNQITAASLVAGLACAWCLATGDYGFGIAGALLLVAAYVLDNADGEIARLKDQCSVFGDRFDTCADWIVHTAFFAALGIGSAGATGADVWLWLGWIAAAGCTLNYLIALVLDARARPAEAAAESASRPESSPETLPETPMDWIVFALRELARADFCFIVLALAVVDATWVLLPAGAVGVQFYWAAQFVRGARDYHV